MAVTDYATPTITDHGALTELTAATTTPLTFALAGWSDGGQQWLGTPARSTHADDLGWLAPRQR